MYPMAMFLPSVGDGIPEVTTPVRRTVRIERKVRYKKKARLTELFLGRRKDLGALYKNS